MFGKIIFNSYVRQKCIYDDIHKTPLINCQYQEKYKHSKLKEAVLAERGKPEVHKKYQCKGPIRRI